MSLDKQTPKKMTGPKEKLAFDLSKSNLTDQQTSRRASHILALESQTESTTGEIKVIHKELSSFSKIVNHNLHEAMEGIRLNHGLTVHMLNSMANNLDQQVAEIEYLNHDLQRLSMFVLCKLGTIQE